MSLMDAHGHFHCAYEYEYHQKKDDLERGVEILEQEREEIDEDEVDDLVLEDLDNLIEFAREIAEGDRSLRDAQSVTDVLEFGLAWFVNEPEECPGYAPELSDEADKVPLNKELLA